MRAAIRVLKPGLLTTVQDRGRWGCQAQGVPVAGPMDPRAHRAANALAGNAPEAATLEVTLIGPEIVFEDERTVAVAGAEFEIDLDGRRLLDRRFVAPAGSCLRFGARIAGARAYVAIEGGIDVAPIFGSRATHVISAMGGMDGRPLRAGDRLPLGAHRSTRSPVRVAPKAPLRFVPDSPAMLRVLPGPQDDYFEGAALDDLQSRPYTIGSSSDRMGFRLEGPRLRHARGADIISDAAPLGSLQVPASGQPILLMADRQTTGGYPKIATVISADIGVAGQLGPGDACRFVVCSRRDAMAALIAQEQMLMTLEGQAR